MQLGIFYGAAGRQLVGDALVADVAAARDAGFASYWVPHLTSGPDALTNLTIAGYSVPDIELGTAVVPMWPRHPFALAQQALTANQVISGRLSLGVGLSHERIVEAAWGIGFERPVRYAREHLTILGAALRNEHVDEAGEMLSGRSDPLLPGAPAPRLYVAALGGQMLDVAGALTDGTILWMTGPKTVAHHIRPAIVAAAERAKRPPPRVLAGLPVLCTSDVDAGRALAAETFARYARWPSYRAMLDREGYSHPAEVALVGDESAIAHRLGELREAGVADVLCSEFGPDEASMARTRACLARLVQSGI